MPYVDNNGVRLHWQEAGSGTPLLLVMGAGFSGALWYPAIPALSAVHRVIWFDNRGTGESQATAVASISDMAGDARAVLDAAGVEQAHAYGVSLGGIIVQQLALESPERVLSIVLGCTGMLTDDKPRAPKWLDVRFRLPRAVSLALSRKALYGPGCPADLMAKDQAVLRSDRTQRLALVAQQDALRGYAVTREQVASLDMPALVLHGTADPIVKTAWGRELADTLPDSRWITYEGAGHNYLVPAGAKASDDVLAFLAHVDDRVATR